MASQDIFGRRPLEFGGAFAADAAEMNISLSSCLDGDGDAITSLGLLIQQISVQYSQPITRLYEVGTQLTYYVAGRPQGMCNISRIVGPGVVMAEIYSCLGNVCHAAGNDLCFCFAAECNYNLDSADGLALCLKNVVLQAVGMSVQAQDMVINENMSLFFTALLAQDEVCTGAQTEDVHCGCDPLFE